MMSINYSVCTPSKIASRTEYNDADAISDGVLKHCRHKSLSVSSGRPCVGFASSYPKCVVHHL